MSDSEFFFKVVNVYICLFVMFLVMWSNLFFIKVGVIYGG